MPHSLFHRTNALVAPTRRTAAPDVAESLISRPEIGSKQTAAAAKWTTKSQPTSLCVLFLNSMQEPGRWAAHQKKL